MASEFPHGEIMSKTVLAESQAQNAVRTDPEKSHRSAGYWPDNGTVLRVLLLVIVVIVAFGGVLTLLNK